VNAVGRVTWCAVPVRQRIASVIRWGVCRACVGTRDLTVDGMVVMDGVGRPEGPGSETVEKRTGISSSSIFLQHRRGVVTARVTKVRAPEEMMESLFNKLSMPPPPPLSTNQRTHWHPICRRVVTGWRGNVLVA
jgi:hypothetical protein